MGMVEDTRPDHDFYQLFSEPTDVGFRGLARSRTWVIGAHRQRTTCLHDPFQIQSTLSAAFRANVQAQVSDFLVASPSEIQMEASRVSLQRGIPFLSHEPNLAYLLGKGELSTKQGLDSKYMNLYQQRPMSNNNLVYFLGDSAAYCSWSASSQKIPTYRLNSKSGKYWLPAQQRWMTSKERLCSMGFPCVKEVAESMHVPMLGATDAARAADMCGNAMHFTTCGIMQLISLACFGPSDICSWFSPCD